MPTNSSPVLCWLRRDLRIDDNRTLAEATAHNRGCVVVFVFDPCILEKLPLKNDRRVNFIYESLRVLDRKLRDHGSLLVVRYGDPRIEIPALAKALNASTVITARDYEPYARDRDKEVATRLESQGVHFQTIKDTVIREGGEVFTQAGTPHRVYTPYARTWRAQLTEGDYAPAQSDLTALVPEANLQEHCQSWSLNDIGFEENSLWLKAGEDAGRDQLHAFRKKIANYAENRDEPAANATSALSVHFRFGTVSIRAAVRLALEVGKDGDKWLAELIWREFYQDLLFHHPAVTTTTFQPQYQNISYPGGQEEFKVWCEGLTGFPIVDAAMRCFNETGWMHNRLRMIVGSFLTKDLLVNYKRGESYFADRLLDFELASNNGGWQWVASVGADAQPYFRIFNPLLQSKKFDPKGEFIRRWVPELADLDNNGIHCPASLTELERIAAGVHLGENYPHPVVDHHVQKDLAVALLSSNAKNIT